MKKESEGYIVTREGIINFRLRIFGYGASNETIVTLPSLYTP
jgi:hypothetical protein